jgi:hypothetical protein
VESQSDLSTRRDSNVVPAQFATEIISIYQDAGCDPPICAIVLKVSFDVGESKLRECN